MAKSKKRAGKQRKQRVPKSDDDFIAAMDRDIARREIEMQAWVAEQAAIDQIDSLIQRIHGQLVRISDSAPKPPHGCDDDPPPFHIRMWADRIVCLARDWNEYQQLMGRLNLPVASDEYGHEAARRIFTLAIESLDVSKVEACIESFLVRLHKFGKKVFVRYDSRCEGTHGLADYVRVVSSSFQHQVGHASRSVDKAATSSVPQGVPSDFARRMLAALPDDGTWKNRDKLLEDAGYNADGGRHHQYLAIMARPGGALVSSNRHGYRRRAAAGNKPE